MTIYPEYFQGKIAQILLELSSFYKIEIKPRFLCSPKWEILQLETMMGFAENVRACHFVNMHFLPHLQSFVCKWNFTTFIVRVQCTISSEIRNFDCKGSWAKFQNTFFNLYARLIVEVFVWGDDVMVAPKNSCMPAQLVVSLKT